MGWLVSYTIDTVGKEMLVVTGVINLGNALNFVTQLTETPYSIGQSLNLDFAEAHFEDGFAVLLTINTLRALANRVASITVHHPPAPLLEGMKGNGILDEDLGISVELPEEVARDEAS